MTLVVGERDDAADGGMALEERGYALVEHKVDLRIGVVGPERREQGSGEYGIAHLPESDDEYLHTISSMVVCL